MEAKNELIVFCESLITAHSKKELTEEQVAYEIIQYFIKHGNPHEEGEKQLFAVCADMEIPRSSSYKQHIGNWDEKVAEKIKQEEWNEFVASVKKLRR